MGEQQSRSESGRRSCTTNSSSSSSYVSISSTYFLKGAGLLSSSGLHVNSSKEEELSKSLKTAPIVLLCIGISVLALLKAGA
jgi:hypothetical protein